MSILEFTSYVGDDDEDVTVRVDSYTAGTAGKYYGPWEDSYPEEPAEAEFTVLRADGSKYVGLTAAEADRIYGECLGKCEPEVGCDE